MNQERSKSGTPKTRPPLSSSSSNYFTSQPSSSPSMTFSTARHTTAPHTSLSTPVPPTPHPPRCPPAPGPLRPSSSFYPQKQSEPAVPGVKGVRARRLEFELIPSPPGAPVPAKSSPSTTLRPPIKLGTWLAEEEYKPQTKFANGHGTHLNVPPRKA
ncbi:hypothetical protein CPB85DRAFT_1437955 [Mucidula mucida]|nr:hypothetical protein CPB85DRAFT_1437955 [Mucidula mucida]